MSVNRDDFCIAGYRHIRELQNIRITKELAGKKITSSIIRKQVGGWLSIKCIRIYRFLTYQQKLELECNGGIRFYSLVTIKIQNAQAYICQEIYRIDKEKATKLTDLNEVIYSWMGSFYVVKISILFILIYTLTEF